MDVWPVKLLVQTQSVNGCDLWPINDKQDIFITSAYVSAGLCTRLGPHKMNGGTWVTLCSNYVLISFSGGSLFTLQYPFTI